jgi:hypothetical protein
MTGVQTSPGLIRKLAKVLCALLVAMAMLAILAWTVSAFAYRTNLSRSSSVISAFPDVAVTADGGYVAAVWANGLNSTSDYGKIRLKRSVVSDNALWVEHKAVFDPKASSGYGQVPRLAFGSNSNTQAHVVWLWGASNTPTQIRYSKCNISFSSLASDCSPNGQVIESLSSNSVVQPEIAVDDSGIPHVVWVNKQLGAIRYAYRQGDGTWAIQTLASNGSAPTIAYARDGSNKYLHVAWVDDSSDQVKYRRGLISAGSTTWTGQPSRTFGLSGLSDAGSPSIAAQGSKVILVWDSAIGGGNYVVAYNRSDDSGANWISTPDWRLVPTGGSDTSAVSVRRISSESGTYTKRLQPDVTLEITNTNTSVHLVWHERTTPGGEGSERYDVFYSSVAFDDLATCSNCWLSPGNVTADTKPVEPALDSGSAAIAVGEGFRHVVYMEEIGLAWDAIYNGDLDASAASEIFMPIILKSSN